MFILVRHAVAVNKKKWSGSDRVRPLTPAGIQQSAALVDVLTRHRIRRLLSSSTARCQSTLAPASEALSVGIEILDALGVDAPPSTVLDLLHSADVEGAALCTHGETFTDLSRAWSDTWIGVSSPPDLTNTPKGGSWVIENYRTLAATATYVRPAVSERSHGVDTASSRVRTLDASRTG